MYHEMMEAEFSVESRAKERAFSSGQVYMADLPALRNWEFKPAEQKTDNELVLKKIMGVDEGVWGSQLAWEMYKKTDIAKIEAQIDTYIAKHPEEWQKTQGKDGEFANPGAAAEFCIAMAANTIRYANEIVPGSKEAKSLGEDKRKAKEEEMDARSADQILESGEGVCRHNAVAAMSIYERLKARDKAGKLKNSYLASTPILGSEDTRNHAFNTLVAIGADRVTISAADSTWLKGLNDRTKDRFVEHRLGSITQMLMMPEAASVVPVEKGEWIGILEERKKRLHDDILARKEQFNPAFCDKYIATELLLDDLRGNIEPGQENGLARGARDLIKIVQGDAVMNKWEAVADLMECGQMMEGGTLGRVEAVVLVAEAAIDLAGDEKQKKNQDGAAQTMTDRMKFFLKQILDSPHKDGIYRQKESQLKQAYVKLRDNVLMAGGNI